jgi:alkanesulfonate monooxygenase SsuD/methylene tetrahydromethanopterin reductase-like flavin-dependent oxidoreductase (luciferase family)
VLKISIQVGSENGLDWPRWKRLVGEIEQAEFASLFLSDHFAFHGASGNSLELIVALSYLADHTEKVHFGSLVSPFSFRDPVMLARQAAALDDLSNGRMILGFGAGNREGEHTMFGYDFGDVSTRMDRLEEGLEVTTRLLRSKQPTSFEGRFFRLKDAELPTTQRSGGPPILVGGRGPRRTLPLVARYADIWNGQHLTPDEFRQRSALLDTLLVKAGRHPRDVQRTISLWLFCGRDEAELERRASWVRDVDAAWADLPLDALFDKLRSRISIFVGTPEEVVKLLRAYEAAGATEVMVQWYGLDDIEGLRKFSEQVLPNFIL